MLNKRPPTRDVRRETRRPVHHSLQMRCTPHGGSRFFYRSARGPVPLAPALPQGPSSADGVRRSGAYPPCRHDTDAAPRAMGLLRRLRVWWRRAALVVVVASAVAVVAWVVSRAAGCSARSEPAAGAAVESVTLGSGGGDPAARTLAAFEPLLLSPSEPASLAEAVPDRPASYNLGKEREAIEPTGRAAQDRGGSVDSLLVNMGGGGGAGAESLPSSGVSCPATGLCSARPNRLTPAHTASEADPAAFSVSPQLRRLFDAIRAVESGGPGDNDGGRALGPYQIHRAYWQDSGVPGRYEECARPEYAERVMLAYWQRYAAEALEREDLEVLARVHNGGPRGWRKETTVAYWRRVQARLRPADYAEALVRANMEVAA